MLALLIVIVVFTSTFVGCNEKVDGSAKAGFFVAFYAIIGVIALLGWITG